MTSSTNSILGNGTGFKLDFDKYYEFGTEIGKGRYATVKKCYCKQTQQCFAAKVIKNFRTKNTKLNLNIVENEITALSIARSHPSIVNLYEVFYHKGETILILEYATEKDLHIYLDSEGAFEEEKACQIIFQVLKAIEFLHSKHVLHLDIKPDNVLLMTPMAPKALNSFSDSLSDEEFKTSNDKNANDKEKKTQNEIKYEHVKVKLCDFSFSQIMIPGQPILGMMGTVAYSAPEVLQYDALTKATDMWSLGVLTHVLLTEYTPFGNGNEEMNQTQTNILSVREKDFECVDEYFENVSFEARDFIENLIKFKPKQRLTVEQALNHSWFKKFNVDESSCSGNDLTENKENLDQTKTGSDKPNHVKLLSSSNNNNNENINLNLSAVKTKSQSNDPIKFSANITKLIEIKDDKNNNNLIETIKINDSTHILSHTKNMNLTETSHITLVTERQRNVANDTSEETSNYANILTSTIMNTKTNSAMNGQATKTCSKNVILDSLIDTTSLTITAATRFGARHDAENLSD